VLSGLCGEIILGMASDFMKFHMSGASGLKSGQSDRRRNFLVSNKGALRRSDLILFVLVLVLVLVLGDQNFIEDEGRGRRRGRLEHI
jgi:hypothetical protein